MATRPQHLMIFLEIAVCCMIQLCLKYSHYVLWHNQGIYFFIICQLWCLWKPQTPTEITMESHWRNVLALRAVHSLKCSSFWNQHQQKRRYRYDNSMSLQWRHNEPVCVSNHQPHDCLLNRLFRRRSKETSKRRATGLCARNSPGTGEFPTERASNAENVSIWWRHHVMCRQQETNFTNPRMHIFHIPQRSIQNRNVHISVLNGALWDMEQAHSGICEFGRLKVLQ